MIRLFSRRISSALNIFPLPAPDFLIPLYKNNRQGEDYKEYNEVTTDKNSDDGYRVLIDVCHESKTVFIDHDMSDYDELNDLPRIIKTFGCLYPNYNLRR
tara:strand:- start:2081 stop:2380 length:300 start_codon:yes stop_codon:yes gene_type:complete